jgi:hypothetical protein
LLQGVRPALLEPAPCISTKGFFVSVHGASATFARPATLGVAQARLDDFSAPFVGVSKSANSVAGASIPADFLVDAFAGVSAMTSTTLDAFPTCTPAAPAMPTD